MSQPSLDRLREVSRKRDVSHDLKRWYPDTDTQEVREIRAAGYRSEARTYLRSTLPEKMYRQELPGDPRCQVKDGLVQIGTASRSERLAKARRFAELAGLPLEEIAEEDGLGHLLRTDEEGS